MAECTYCGDPHGDEADHVIPKTTTGDREGLRQETVPACRECNGLLGDKMYVTIQTRAAYLLGAVEARYKKVISMPVWDDEELEDLGPNMRASIEAVLTRERVSSPRRDLRVKYGDFGRVTVNKWRKTAVFGLS
jgi:hypothetical protein